MSVEGDATGAEVVASLGGADCDVATVDRTVGGFVAVGWEAKPLYVYVADHATAGADNSGVAESTALADAPCSAVAVGAIGAP